LPATKEEIEAFLDDVRKTSHNSFDLRSKKENRDTITALGYTNRDVINEICSLSPRDYSEGPLSEHSTTNEVWIFGKIIHGKEVYIKFKLIGINNSGQEIDTVHCLSFHFARECLNYPHRN
jgi:hypothetical protein